MQKIFLHRRVVMVTEVQRSGPGDKEEDDEEEKHAFTRQPKTINILVELSSSTSTK